MAVRLVRAGSHGEYETQFLGENRVYLTWDLLDQDLSKVSDRSSLNRILTDNAREILEQALNKARRAGRLHIKSGLVSR